MNIGKLEPTLRVLLEARKGELRHQAELGRVALEFVEGKAWIIINVTHEGLQPPRGAEVLYDRGEIMTLRLPLTARRALSDRKEVIYVAVARSGNTKLHRSRLQIGANIVDGYSIRSGTEAWDGTGVTLGIIDLAFDVRHPALRQFPGGPTRVHMFWDRSPAAATRRPHDQPGDNNIGVVYDRATIDRYLLGPPANPSVLHPNSVGLNQHGNHVAAIAGGSAAPYKGVAPGATLILVQITDGDFGQLTQICDWIFRNAVGPCSINISLGNNSGPHDGTSALERALDDFLRDPAPASNLAPIAGRFMAVAAGNEGLDGWHTSARVLGAGRPVTPIVWESPFGNAGEDQIEFWYSGLDRIRIRLVAPNGQRTNFVTADPANPGQSIEEAVPGALAATTPGSQAQKTFAFPDGTNVRVMHAEEPINGDRQIEIHFLPAGPGTPGAGSILEGIWQLEFQGVTDDMPGGGMLHGWLRDDVPNTRPDSRFQLSSLVARELVIIPGETLRQDLWVPAGRNHSATVELDYPQDRELSVQVRPPLHLLSGGQRPGQVVHHGVPDPVAVADAALTAPGAATAEHLLPFVFGPQTVEIGHTTVAGRKRITIRLLGSGPAAGLYEVSLTALSGNRPVHVDARITQPGAAPFNVTGFRDRDAEAVELEVFPDSCIVSVLRFAASNVLDEAGLQVVVPAGAAVDVRVRIPPADRAKATGGRAFTPWISAGNIETAVNGSLPVNGGAAAARVYGDGATARVTIDFPAPAAGADAVARVTLANPSAAAEFLREGDWRIELRSRDDTSHRVRCEVRHITDDVGFTGLLGLTSPEADQLVVEGGRSFSGPTVIPFVLDEDCGDEIRLEVLYPSTSPVSVRLRPPDPHRLPYRVEPANRAVVDAGAPAPATGAAGVTGSLRNGTLAVIDHPSAEVFAGHRRALISIRPPQDRAVYHPRGIWRLEIDPMGGDPASRVTLRISADGRAPSFLRFQPPDREQQQGSLSVPGCGREIMSVANGLSDLAPIIRPLDSSSPGPVRSATRMRLGGSSRQWQPYTKPELIAPGTAIAAASSTFAPLWVHSTVPFGWTEIDLPDGRHFEMHDTAPLIEGTARRFVKPVPTATAAGVLTETSWDVLIPENNFRARLRIRYPRERAFAVRIEQPAAAAGIPAPAAPTRTHAVRPTGQETAVAGAGVAAGSDAFPHPDGRGRTYQFGDDTQATIRQDGAGLATVELRGETELLHTGVWRIIVQHEEQFAGPAQVAVESEPEGNAHGWPHMGFGSPRAETTIPQALGAANPATVGVLVDVRQRMVSDFSLDVTYPPPPVAGAYTLEVLVLTPGGARHTSSIETTGILHQIDGAVGTVGAPVQNGARFGLPFGPNGQNRVVITHVPGHARVTFSRGTSTAFRIEDGEWEVRVLNRSTTSPAAPVPVRFDMEIGPHDAPFLHLPDGPIPAAFTRFGHIAANVSQEWRFRVPERRREPLSLTLIYDARDTLSLQLQDVTGARTEAVGLANVQDAGAPGVTLARSGAGADGVEFVSAGRFRATLNHAVQPLSRGSRNEVRVTLHAVDGNPLEPGDWILHLRPTVVDAASNGVVEAFIDEMLFRVLSGTSMASPHVAGLAALLLQQDHTRTHVDIKRLLLSTARPLAITRGGALQLPNQWDSAAGWGLVDGRAALLEHGGGILHNRGAPPAAVGRTTGCPVACDDNCLLEGVRSNGSIVGLRPTRDAPYNRAPASAGAVSLATCQRQSGYMAERSGAAFTGGGTFQSIPSRRVATPLVREREQRGGLEGFRPVGWEEAYRTIVDRFVEQWTQAGGILLIEPRPRLGLVRELLFNRFSHQLHRLLGASTTVTKCSFTIKKTVSVATSRVPFGAPTGGAAEHGLRELWNDSPPRLIGRGELSLARNVVLWGANLAATAADLWSALRSMHSSHAAGQRILVIDPAMQALPPYVRRLAILPGSDRELALALMLCLVGNPAHAEAARQIPEHPRFADPVRGLRPLLDPISPTLGDFITHVRAASATYLRIEAGRVTPDVELVDRCLGAGASATAVAGFRDDFDALFDAYLHGPTTTILGDGPARHVEGEENTQYIAALAFVSGNMGIAGAGVGYAEDREAAFNPSSFSGSHNTMRPEVDREMGSEAQREEINLASLGVDTPDGSRIGLWFDLDPLTALPDAAAVEAVLRRLQLNIQVTGRLDDSSRFADIILPLGDSLISYDLQLGARSPWLTLTQPLEAPSAEGPRPFARVVHELFAALHARLKDDFEDDLKPVINQAEMTRGPLQLSPTGRQQISQLFTDANRIPNLLRDRLPGDEVANIHTQLKNWYASVHGGQPTTDTDSAITFDDPVKFFNRMQVDWILEVLLDRYGEREAVMILYNLLQRGTALDPLRFGDGGFSLHPDGDTAFAANVARGSAFVNLKGAAGFAPERPAYRDAIRAADTAATGRAAYPMRLVIAESPAFASTSIPLSAQVEGGRVKPPIVVLNPASASLEGRFGGPLADGAEVAVVGNVSYAAGQRFETVIAKVQVRTDSTMARETLLMNPGWHGLDRGGQRVVRGVHTEEGESPAMFDNLVRLEPANYSPAANAADRGAKPPKR